MAHLGRLLAVASSPGTMPAMEIRETPLAGAFVLEPRVFKDDRGFFLESWNRRVLRDAGLDLEFVQDNHSRSTAGVLRGIHYQLPDPQGKLVRATSGTVWDVAVDLRRSSATFLDWTAVILDDVDHRQLWIPPGFGHGFCVMSDTADVAYKATTFYDGSCDRAIRYDDPAIGIDWPIRNPVLSTKDEMASPVVDAVLFD